MATERIAMLIPLMVALSPSPAASTPLRHVVAGECGECHPEIFAQWQTSMHAKSTALVDPIHGAFYRNVIGDPRAEGVRSKKGGFPVCLKCHAPSAARDGKTKLDARPSYSEGVGCTTCHGITRFRGTKGAGGKLRLGTDAYDFATDTLYSASGAALAGDDHPWPVVGNALLFKTSAVCLGCHDRRTNSKGVSLCQTGDEMVASRSQIPCQSCHMPLINGVADHSMPGGHSRDMVRRGLAMGLEARRDSGVVHATVTLLNLLPHKLPTGAPFRSIYIKVVALNSAGTTVWQSSEKHPFVADKRQDILMYRLGDDAGHFAPPPKATRVLEDTRLAPHERRVLRYEIRARGVARVRVRVFYELLLPPFKKMLGEALPAALTAPMEIATAEVKL